MWPACVCDFNPFAHSGERVKSNTHQVTCMYVVLLLPAQLLTVQVFVKVRSEEWNVYRRYAEFREFHRQVHT